MEGNKNYLARRRGPVSLGSYTKEEFKKLDKRSDFPIRSSKPGGLSYGFNALDWLTYGIQSEDFIVIAGRSSTGKTDFLLNIAGNVTGPDSDVSVIIFSMKLSAEHIHNRFICSRAGVRADHFYMVTLEDIEYPKIVSAATHLQSTPIFVDDSPVNSLEELGQKITTFQSERKISLVVIDSLQHLSDVRDQSDTSQIAYLSRSIKSLARELQVPILSSVHISGSAQTRFDKSPTIKNLEAWEGITEYADIVGFLHCEDISNEFENDNKVLKCILRKNINGGLGKLSFLYEPAFHRFTEVHITDETAMIT